MNSWSTQLQFDDDINQLLLGYVPAPPRAHRVRGHVRRLGEGTPSDSALDHTPPYIRRHMAPGETWLRGHSRGGDLSGELIFKHLRRYSSLADFQVTATRV